MRLVQMDLAAQHPAFLLQFVECVDSRSGDVFDFELLTKEECAASGAKYISAGWSWQREYLDWILSEDLTITLKGRQLGVTWVWAGLALWYLLHRPGSDVLVYSITEKDAIEVVQRIWGMFESLPQHLRNGIEVLRPARGARPTTEIEIRHRDGRVSSITGMAATKAAGHGRSAALVIFDEGSRQEYAREIWKAVVPAAGDAGGKIGVVSTANGMSDERSGLGNFFHHLWVNSGKVDYPKLKKRFLGWWLHPARDDEWYKNISLKADDKAEQYPNDPEEAFLMSGRPYFDGETIKWYAKHAVRDPLYQAKFEVSPENPARGRLVKGEGLPLEVYKEPEDDRLYALAADVASGSGDDYSVGALIDLHTGEPCAEFRMKAGYDDFAEQLHFLGLWYNKARLAVEDQGGYGAAVIAYLREPIRGRRPYPKLYRHRKLNRPDHIEATKFGFPMDQATRPKVVNELRSWVDDKLFPFVTRGFLQEARTFVHREKKPSPAAADGANDDIVMAWGIALELFSLFGEHEHDRRKKTRKNAKAWKAKPSYPWQRT
jgi:hypothetical protein